MPVLQLYEPANPFAINCDHQYSTMTLEEAFLKSAKLTVLTREEIADVEFSTRGQAENKMWLEERKKRITSSNFSTICKSTAQRDMNVLASQLVSPRQFRSRATDYGRVYEPVAVEKFEQIMGPTKECGLFVHKDFPWLAASPDRVVMESGSLHAVLEVKCPYSAKNKDIGHVTVPYLKKSTSGLTLDKKHAYYYQIQGQLACTDAEFCYFCVFTQKDLRIVKITRDNEFISSIVGKLNHFYSVHFERVLFDKYVYKSYNSYF